MPIRNQSDIAAVEAVPLSLRALPESSYAALVDASKRSPDARALSFFLSADRLDEAHVWTYAELVADVTRVANVFAALGVTADRPVAYVLPNLPETHLAIWGGEAAGAALAVKMAAAGSQLKVVNLREVMREQPSDRLLPPRTIKADDISSYFCTGGTTGAPKIAGARTRKRCSTAGPFRRRPKPTARPEAILCGLPLFHVNGQLVTGLAPWSSGEHVVMATPEGYRGEGVIAISGSWSRFRITMFSGVPTVYSALLQTPIADATSAVSERRSAARRRCRCHSSTLSSAKTGVRILEGYGLTEGACASSSTPLDAERASARSAFDFPIRTWRLIARRRRPLSRMADVDEIGVIAIRGPNVFAGYLDPAHNKGIWIERAGESLAQHRRPRPTGRRRLLLAHRAQEGADHPRRAQHRSEAIEDALQRIRPSPWSRRSEVRTRTPANCPSPMFSSRPAPPSPRRSSSSTRRGRSPKRRRSRSASRSRRPADDGGRQALQAGARRARDRGDHSRRGREGRRSDRVGQGRARPAKRSSSRCRDPRQTATVSRRLSIDTHSHRR